MSSSATAMVTEVRAEFIIGTIIFLVRWFTRWITKIWGWDDLFSLSAWIFFALLYSMEEYLGK